MRRKRTTIRAQLPEGSFLEAHLRSHDDAPRRLVELATLGLVTSQLGVHVTVINSSSQERGSATLDIGRAGAPTHFAEPASRRLPEPALPKERRNPLLDLGAETMKSFGALSL